MKTLNWWVLGGALAITLAVLYTICAVAFVLWPEATLSFFNVWLHGVDLTLLRTVARVFSWSVFAYGLVGLAASLLLAGALFALCYNHCVVLFGKRAP